MRSLSSHAPNWFLSQLALQETGTLQTMWRYSDRIISWIIKVNSIKILFYLFLSGRFTQIYCKLDTNDFQPAAWPKFLTKPILVTMWLFTKWLALLMNITALFMLGHFACSLLSADFFKINIFKKLFQELYKCTYGQPVKKSQPISGPTDCRAWYGSKLSANLIQGSYTQAWVKFKDF